MPDAFEPAETIDRSVTVRVLDDDGSRETVSVPDYETAIVAVRERSPSATAVKIESRDDEVVFTSTDMDIDVWEQEFENALRRQEAAQTDHECPHENVNCFPDDPCVDCQIDAVQSEARKP